ncbi:MAG: FAD-dependent oxidoreductase [Actinomycetes bacterium]
MTTTPYWLDRPLDPVGSAVAKPKVDVVVIGAGVTGCSCALALAERGLSVRLLDTNAVASGASGRNGGFALGGGAMSYLDARSRLGTAGARQLWQLADLGLDRLESLAGDAFRRVGSLRLAADRAELETIEAEGEALREDGFAVEAAGSLPPVLAGLYAGAIRYPRDGAVDPPRWVRRLAARAATVGVEIVERRPVEADALDAFDAVVVVATDGLIASLLPELATHVVAVRGQMLATAPLAELRFPHPHYAREGFDYWQQLPDGRLLIGGCRDQDVGNEYTASDATTGAVQREIEQLATRLVGHLPPVTHRWSGAWGETADLLPLVGRVPGRDRIWVAGGYSGHGNVLGLVCGELLARAIVGETAAGIELFDPTRFG